MVWIAPAIAAGIAILPLPYGAYAILKLVICIGAAVIAWTGYATHHRFDLRVLVFGAIAILFNPLLPIHSTRSIWMAADAFALVMFIIDYVRCARGK
jgi:hypothetical protein